MLVLSEPLNSRRQSHRLWQMARCTRRDADGHAIRDGDAVRHLRLAPHPGPTVDYLLRACVLHVAPSPSPTHTTPQAASPSAQRPGNANGCLPAPTTKFDLQGHVCTLYRTYSGLRIRAYGSRGLRRARARASRHAGRARRASRRGAGACSPRPVFSCSSGKMIV